MGDIKYYKYITALVMISFIANIAILLILNITTVTQYLDSLFGIKKTFVMQLFFWSALGATIACSLFMSEDKEINEVERVKNNPDPKVLRYPDVIDVSLYLQRIITSGVLGVIGALMLFAGLIFFEAQIEVLSIKHKMFFIVFCFLIGMYQRNFITYLGKMFRRIIEDKNK
jgi:hypothetical protein